MITFQTAKVIGKQQLITLPVNGQQLLIVRNKITVHRPLTNWDKFKPIIPTRDTYLVLQDYFALLYLLTNGINPSKIIFWHTDEPQTNIASATGVKIVLCTPEDLESQLLQMKNNNTPIDWTASHICGNFAFDIDKLMIALVKKLKPASFCIISTADAWLSNKQSSKHKSALEMRDNWLDAGTRCITHIPLHTHERVIQHKTKANILELDTAAVITVCAEGIAGYNGDVEIKDLVTKTGYSAKRNSCTFARTKFAYRMSEHPNKMKLNKHKEIKVTQVAHPNFWNDANQFDKVIIRHYTVGAVNKSDDSKEQFALKNAKMMPKGTNLKFAKGQDWYNGGEFDCIPIYFGSSLEMESFYSLTQLDIMNKVYNDIVWKRQGASGPGLLNLPALPLDRIWTEQTLIDYVKTNY